MEGKSLHYSEYSPTPVQRPDARLLLTDTRAAARCPTVTHWRQCSGPMPDCYSLTPVQRPDARLLLTDASAAVRCPTVTHWRQCGGPMPDCYSLTPVRRPDARLLLTDASAAARCPAVTHWRQYSGPMPGCYSLTPVRRPDARLLLTDASAAARCPAVTHWRQCSGPMLKSQPEGVGEGEVDRRQGHQHLPYEPFPAHALTPVQAEAKVHAQQLLCQGSNLSSTYSNIIITVYYFMKIFLWIMNKITILFDFEINRKSFEFCANNILLLK